MFLLLSLAFYLIYLEIIIPGKLRKYPIGLRSGIFDRSFKWTLYFTNCYHCARITRYSRHRYSKCHSSRGNSKSVRIDIMYVYNNYETLRIKIKHSSNHYYVKLYGKYVRICSSAERTPVLKHISTKETDMSARSSTTCPTPEFRMSVLLARDEHSGSQKELHNKSPAMRTKSIHSRDKSGLRTRDTLRLVNEKQPTSLYEVCYFYTLKNVTDINNLDWISLIDPTWSIILTVLLTM